MASPERDVTTAGILFEPDMPRRMRPQSLPAEYQRISASGSTLEPAAACVFEGRCHLDVAHRIAALHGRTLLGADAGVLGESQLQSHSRRLL